jgi:hypothetical protein
MSFELRIDVQIDVTGGREGAGQRKMRARLKRGAEL